MRFEEQSDDQWKLKVPSIILPACNGKPRADERVASTDACMSL